MSGPQANPTEDDRDLTLKALRTRKNIEFSFDPDGKLYIDITDRDCRECNGRHFYLGADEVKKLRDWLNKVARHD